jgi:adenylyltransferase/sulfurtransferase
MVKEITVKELKNLMDSQTEFQLIDVREPKEFEICNLNGELVPMADIEQYVENIRRDQQVVIHCRSGKRSAEVIKYLQQQYGFDNLYNLKGGILQWSDEIDSSIQKY